MPDGTFHIRVRDDLIEDPSPVRWEDKTTTDYFAREYIILFSHPSTFAVACSTYQPPGFENGFGDFSA